MDFVSLDFETADYTRHSPCEIGLTFVENMKIVDKKSFLIRPACFPDFDLFNVSLHGIGPETVKDCETFDTLYQNSLKAMLANKLVISHNSAFDIGVLRETLNQYNLPWPTLDYLCTLTLSRRLFPDLISYSLPDVAKHIGVTFQPNHRALTDSTASAEVAIEIFTRHSISNAQDIATKLNYHLGKLSTNNYSGFTHKRKNKSFAERFGLDNVDIDVSSFDKESVLYNKTVVFTGKLSSMSRPEAAQLVTKIGAIFSDKLNSKTEILVIGQQDVRVVGADGESSKQRKANTLKQKGQSIEVMSEHDFLQNIGW